MPADLVYGFACNTAMKRNKIHTILRMQTNHINKILGRQCSKVSLIVNIIEWMQTFKAYSVKQSTYNLF